MQTNHAYRRKNNTINQSNKFKINNLFQYDTKNIFQKLKNRKIKKYEKISFISLQNKKEHDYILMLLFGFNVIKKTEKN